MNNYNNNYIINNYYFHMSLLNHDLIVKLAFRDLCLLFLVLVFCLVLFPLFLSKKG